MVEQQEEFKHPKHNFPAGKLQQIMDKSRGENPEFYEKFEKIGEKPIGQGMFADVWLVKRKGDEEGAVYAAKEFNDGFNWGYEPELRPLQVIKHPKIVNLVDSLPNNETGGVLILGFLPGKAMREKLLETKGTLLPKKEMIKSQI